MNDAWLMALGSIVTGVIAAAVAGLVSLLNALAKNRQARDESTTVRQNAIIDRLEKQIERHERAAAETQAEMGRITEMHAECREESAEARAVGEYAIDYTRRLHGQLLAAGIKVEPLPDFRLPPRRTSLEEAEFVKRTAAQNATLVTALDSQVKPSVPPAITAPSSPSPAGGTP